MVGLTARKVDGLKEPGMYGDGADLYLCVSKGGTNLGFYAPLSMGIAANLA